MASLRRPIAWLIMLPFRLLAFTILRLPLLVLVLGGYIVWHTLPDSRLSAVIPGLTSPVAIGIDADGIPHVRAANEFDAAAALGFLHARDRLFQMEVMRRTASGTLSEIAGRDTLPTDRLMRTLGLRRAAEAELDRLPPEAQQMLAAYANGVNAYIALRGRFAALPFVALGRPHRWAPVDSLLWGKLMGLYLSGNWQTELARARLLDRLSPEAILSYWPSAGGPGQPQAALAPALAPAPPGLAAAATRLARVLPHFPDRFTQPATASDAWAVAGSHSATGAPLLAGDPHLGFSLPGPWYLVRIDTPSRTLAGATAPGVPFMILGRNRHIAWTFTSTGADTQDLFIETPAGPGRYLTPDGPRPFATREETIHVLGEPDQTLTVRSTRHGPLISDLTDRGHRGPLIAVAMAGLAPDADAAAGLLALNRAGSVAEALAGARAITAPVQNLMVADRAGIALAVVGRVPIRKAGDGALPSPGADGSHDWTGWAGGADLPRIVDPPSGRLVNANDRVAPPDFPIFLARDWYADYRARRIRQLLDARAQHSVADFAAMQTDTLDLAATDLLPTLTRLHPRSTLAHQAMTLLELWNGHADAHLPQPLIFTAWMKRARNLLLRRHRIPPLAAAPWPVLIGSLVAPDGTITPAGAALCGEHCGRLFARAFAHALYPLAKRWGRDPFDWRWGAAHEAVFANALLSRVPWLDRLAVARVPAAGDDNTLDRGGTPEDGFRSVHGASFRAVYDLADLDRSRFMLAPGQSGHLISGRARNFLSRWRAGDTISLGPGLPRAARLQLLPPAR